MVVLQNTDIDVVGSFRERGIELTPLKSAHMVSKFDLTFEFTEAGEQLQLSIEYNTDLFDRTRIERAATHFENVLRAMLDDGESRIGDVSILSGGEREQLVEEFNQTGIAFQTNRTMQELFEDWARQTPDAIAVKIEDRAFSYRELNERSNRLAHYLRDKFDIVPGDWSA